MFMAALQVTTVEKNKFEIRGQVLIMIMGLSRRPPIASVTSFTVHSL